MKPSARPSARPSVDPLATDQRIAANDVEGAARALTAHLRRANKRYGNQPTSPVRATAPHSPAPATSRRRST